jgi:RNA polymerase sigma-70 factor (ECF subfamily)
MALENIRAAGGEVAARELDWDAIYADQLPRIYAYCRYRCGSDAEAEDLAARTFEKAWRSRDRYRSDLAEFSTWLYRIAQNLCADHHRARRDHLPLDAAMDAAVEGTPELHATRESDFARMSRLVALLPERERELIALRYGADLGHQFIARLTGLSVSNVSTILHRAVQLLRARW